MLAENEEQEQAKKEKRVGENFVSRLYLHKIVVSNASEDNEMKLNK